MERDIGRVLGHALIQRQSGVEWTALGQISLKRAAIYTNVKVNTFFEVMRVSLLLLLSLSLSLPLSLSLSVLF